MRLEIIMLSRISQTLQVFYHLSNLDLKLWCLHCGEGSQAKKEIMEEASKESVDS